jgi:hypothetical protein
MISGTTQYLTFLIAFCLECKIVSTWLTPIHSNWTVWRIQSQLWLWYHWGGDVWHAGPQLFFNCTLYPTCVMDDSGSHKAISLFFFRALELQKVQKVAYRGKVFRCCTNGLTLRCHAKPLCQPSGEFSSMCASDHQHSMLLEGQHAQYNPTQLQHLNSKEIAADSKRDRGTWIWLLEINIWMWLYATSRATSLWRKQLQCREKKKGRWIQGNSCCNSLAQEWGSLMGNTCASANNNNNKCGTEYSTL